MLPGAHVPDNLVVDLVFVKEQTENAFLPELYGTMLEDIVNVFLVVKLKSDWIPSKKVNTAQQSCELLKPFLIVRQAPAGAP
jgi:hypothetical protein